MSAHSAPSDLPPPARPEPDCPRCRGSGTLTAAQGEQALAEPCPCIGPCRRCKGTGQVTLLVEGGVQVGRCRCRMVGDRAALFNHARIPGRYAAADFPSFATGAHAIGQGQPRNAKFEAFLRVMSWEKEFDARRENRGFVLHGLVGRGKTHLLVATLRALSLNHGVRVRFIEFSRLLSELREGFETGRSGATLLNELVEVPVLGIDELGKGRMTDWELSVIDELVSRRYNAMACTLGTTNFLPGMPTGAAPSNLAQLSSQQQTLGDRVGERVYSRLREMGDFIEIGGDDFREFKRRTGYGGEGSD